MPARLVTTGLVNRTSRSLLNRLTVDGVAEDDGLVDLQLREERVEAVHFLALRNEGIELGDTLLKQKTKKRNEKTKLPSTRVVV